MRPLVITSINPYAKINYQKLCFEQWKRIGYKVLSFNSTKECEALVHLGFNENDMVIINQSETALDLFGKPIPRILPILNRAIQLNAENYLLVNSDIYATHRKPVISFLRTINECIALTRNESMSLEDNSYTDSFPYRGGLDIFFFTDKALSRIFNKLMEAPVSERMTFGIPGWDFYLSHIILEMGGSMMDGEVFVHQSHPVSYSNIEEFQHYVDRMKKTYVFKKNETNAIAAEYAERINQYCETNQLASKQLKKIYYQPPKLSKPDNQNLDKNEIETSLLTLLQKQGVYFSGLHSMGAFIASQTDTASWNTAELFCQHRLNYYPIIESRLIILLIQLLIKKKKGNLNISCEYPEGNQHKAALRQIIDNTAVGIDRDYKILALFASELSHYAIFNPELFKYLILSSKTKNTLSICAIILNFCQEN